MTLTSADAVQLAVAGFAAGVSVFLVVGFITYGVLHALRFIEAS